MLSVRSISSADAGSLSLYYEGLAQVDEYYEAGEEPPGEWMGDGAEKLGLSGQVQEGHLLAAMQGYNPETGEALAKNAGDQHKPGWDATFSAPKSVSTIWAAADKETREKISEAHKNAVGSALGYLEQQAVSTRFGKGGHNKGESGGLTVATYEHGTNRNQDPQLHTHCIVMNVSPDGRGLDFDTRHKMSAGALYRAELASQLMEQGFQVERDGDSFAITGVNKDLTEQWSSRRSEIEAELERTGNTGSKAASVAALNTRNSKKSMPREQLYEQWHEQAAEHGFTAESVNDLKEMERPDPQSAPQMKSGAEIMEELTRSKATVSDVQIRAAVAVEAQGFLNAEQAEKFTTELLQSEHVIELKQPEREEGEQKPDHIKGGQRFTTQSVLDAEKDMLERTKRMKDNNGHKVSDEAINRAFEGMPTITDEQKSAAKHITQESGQVSVLQGRAGAGKSFTLGAVREAFENDGYNVIGTAVSNAATRNLLNEAGIESKNTTLLEIEIENGKTELNEKTVLIVDEAGMQSTRQTASLLEKAEQAGAKVVLVGDTQQLQAIESGAPMRAIGNQVGIAELSDVRRQKTERGREMAGHFREGRADKGLDMLREDGHLHVNDTMAGAALQAADGYLDDTAAGKESIAVAATRREVGMLNTAIRQGMKDQGMLGDDGIIAKTSSGKKEFATGDRVIFGEKHAFGERGDDDTTTWNGAKGGVVATGENAIDVKLDHSGKTVSVNFDEMNKVDHGYATTVHKAQGLSVDTAHVLAGGQSGREWSYVAASRHKETVTMYTDKETEKELYKSMAQNTQKDMATDYDYEDDEIDLEAAERELAVQDSQFTEEELENISGDEIDDMQSLEDTEEQAWVDVEEGQIEEAEMG